MTLKTIYLDDPYFFERKESISNTLKAVESGSMNTKDFNTSIDNLIIKLEFYSIKEYKC